MTPSQHPADPSEPEDAAPAPDTPDMPDTPDSPEAGRSGPRRMTVGLVSAAAAVVLGGVAVVAFTGNDEKPTGTSTAASGFELPALNGSGDVALADFHGKPTVVNLFASWCDVCDLELPGFVKLSRELDGKVNFVGVDSMETGDRNLMVKRHHLEAWKLARDVGPHGRGLHDALAPGFGGMPITAFYDGTGKLVRVQKGGLLEDDLRDTLAEVYGIR
jgi:thiol-disulfide isomerase/thioredoxin